MSRALGMYYREVAPPLRTASWHLVCALVFLASFYVGFRC